MIKLLITSLVRRPASCIFIAALRGAARQEYYDLARERSDSRNT